MGNALHVYADADFAGCRFTKRSTTGGFTCAEGESTFFPIGYVSKRQSAVSHSTPKAEIVSADHVLRTMAIPALQVWDVAFGPGGVSPSTRTTRP